MENLIRIILSNSLYATIVGVVCVAIIFFVLKKMVKLLLYAFLFLCIVLAYIYYSGESVSTLVKPVQSTVRKVEKSVQENKVAEEVAQKAGKVQKK